MGTQCHLHVVPLGKEKYLDFFFNTKQVVWIQPQALNGTKEILVYLLIGDFISYEVKLDLRHTLLNCIPSSNGSIGDLKSAIHL